MLFFVTLALFALLTGVLWGTGFFSGLLNIGSLPASSLPGHSQPTTTTSVSSRSTQSASSIQPAATTTSASSTSTAPSASASASYPSLSTSYQGSISDKFTTPPTTSSLSLSQIQQHDSAIRGFFSVGPGLVGDGNFTGSVTTDKKIQFTVPSYAGLLPLLFQGQIKADGSMTGTYCSYQGNNQCNPSAGGYGDWQLTKPTSGS